MSNLFLATAPFDFKAIFSSLIGNWYYYIIALCLIVFIALFLRKNKKSRCNLNKTQKIAYVAIFSALAAVGNIYIPISQTFQISLVAFVGFIAGFLLGPGLAFTSCFIGDFIIAVIMPHGAYNPIIAFGTGLWGLTPGIIFTYFKGNNYIKLIISFVISIILVSGVINTFGIWIMYGLGKHTFVYYLADFPLKAVFGVINAILSVIVMKILIKVLPKTKFNLS